MEHIEHGSELCIDMFPSELARLVAGSVSDPYKLRWLRQLLLFSYKAYVQHDKQTEDAAYATFTSTNDAVCKFGNSFSETSPRLLDSVRKHVQSVLYRFDEKGIIPFHGPGASITPKARWTKWYRSIDYVYPYSDYYACYFNRHHIEEFGDPTDEHIRAKLIAVPMTVVGLVSYVFTPLRPFGLSRAFG
jgi:hypothetical protein